MPRLTPQHWKTLVRVFEAVGFSVVHTVGDHIVMHKPGAPRRVVIPKKTSVDPFIIKGNLRTAGLGNEEYFALLDSL